MMEAVNQSTGEVVTLPTQSASIAALADALAKAQGKIKGAIKDATNPHFKSSYADLASVWDACRDQLATQGLAVIQTTANGINGVTIVTTLAHSSGEWIRGELTLKPVKEDPQGVGSAITYARRYALAAMVGIAPEDDDGNAASGRGTQATTARQAQPRQEAEPWKDKAETVKAAIDAADDITELDKAVNKHGDDLKAIKEKSESAYGFLMDRSAKRRGVLSQAPRKVA